MELSYNALPARIKEKIQIDPKTGCWLWTAGLYKLGYGNAWDPIKKKGVCAHRLVYELLAGPIPKHLQIDHLCKIKRCCNPKHLELTTARINVLRSDNICAQNHRKLFCKNGHPLIAENVIHRSNGGRKCRLCHAAEEAKRRAKDPEKTREANRKWKAKVNYAEYQRRYRAEKTQATSSL